MIAGLGAVEFGDRIIFFGAALMVSVLPLIIVLSNYASHHIQDDITEHLGLSRQGHLVVESLFRGNTATFSAALLFGLLLSFAGTVAVARSVEVIYERSFGLPPIGRRQSLVRSVVWVVLIAAIVIGDGAIGKTLRDGPAGAFVFTLVELVGFSLFFWWSMHFLLGGRVPWSRLVPAAIGTAVLWIALGMFAAFYFSSTIVSDSQTYGPIGVAFTLVTWFIAMGAVLTLGAVVGAVWQRRRSTESKEPVVPVD